MSVERDTCAHVGNQRDFQYTDSAVSRGSWSLRDVIAGCIFVWLEFFWPAFQQGDLTQARPRSAEPLIWSNYQPLSPNGTSHRVP